MGIAARGQSLADARWAVTQPDVAMFADGIREFDEASMLLRRDERPYVAPVLLHPSIALEVGAQLRLLGGRARRRGECGVARR
jgi:hypothetical protein